MHIPDGFLDTKVALTTGAISAAGLGFALWHARRHLPPRNVPLLGLSAAFVFAAQMLNFPVAMGTSGHLVGGVLTAALLGPSAAVIVISSVLILQCFFFADGGMTALGANILNMAIIAGVGGWAIYYPLTRCVPGLFGRIFAAIAASWISTVLAAVVCAGEVASSGSIAWSAILPPMAGVHMLIGIGEGLITALVLLAIARTHPQMLGLPPTGSTELTASLSYAGGNTTPRRSRLAPFLVFGLLISLGLALFVAPFACPWPDGLDKTAEHLGFANQQNKNRPVTAWAHDYHIPGIASAGLSTALAGAAGTVLIFGVSYLLAKALVPKAVPQRAAAVPSAHT